MNKRLVFLSVGIAILVLITAKEIPASGVQTDRSSFSISVETGPDGVQFSCTEGCAWSELAVRCPGGDCSFELDEWGMVHPEEANP